MDKALKETRTIRNEIDARNGKISQAEIKKEKENAVKNFLNGYTGAINMYKRPSQV